MARVETVRCDQCGAIKGEGNHWLNIDVYTESALLRARIVIELSPPHELPETSAERRDLCGQECFHKHLDALLFTKPKPIEHTI